MREIVSPPVCEKCGHPVNLVDTDLYTALKEAVGVIKIWHGAAGWDIYRAHSPEMERITAALARVELVKG